MGIASTALDQAEPRSFDALLRDSSSRHRTRTALSVREGDGWRHLRYGLLQRHARRVSSALMERGLAPGDRAAILGESRPEWVVALFATLRAGGVVAPLDVLLTTEELAGIARAVRPTVLFTSRDLVQRALEVKRAVPSIELVVVLDGPGSLEGAVAMRDLIPERIHPRHAGDPEDCALLASTSGTTGRPRLVRVPYRSLAFQVQAFERTFPMGPGEVYLSILPLHHMYELTCGLLSALNCGAEIAYVRSLIPSDIVAALRARRATRMLVVPLFLEMLKKSIEANVRSQGPARERRFRTAQALAAKLPALALRRALFGELHRRLGGRLRAFHCGGAPLAPDVAAFFDTLGIAVHAGYGLTETGPVVTTNTERERRLGSVGRPLPGVEVSIAPSPHASPGGPVGLGEILTRGPHVMLGYDGEQQATAEAIDPEGWFHTGDLGWTDELGFLYVTGRSKNMIVLDSGKKVQPEEVEGVLARIEGVKDVCVLGRSGAGGAVRGGEIVEAVVVPAEELVEACRGDDQALQRELEVAVKACRTQLAAHKLPSRVHLLRGELPKTTTAKLRRDAVRRLVEERSA